MRILIIIALLAFIFNLIQSGYSLENKLNKQENISDSLFNNFHVIKKQNDSLQRELNTCKWMGAREYHKFNLNIK